MPLKEKNRKEIRKRKKRKREWMLKAYMLTAGSKGIKGGDEDLHPTQSDNQFNYNNNIYNDNNNNNIYNDNDNNHNNQVDENQNPIEMCDSFSSRASDPSNTFRDQDYHNHHHPSDGHLTQQYTPTDGSNFDEQKLLEHEKEILSKGIAFRYSNLENKKDKSRQLHVESIEQDVGGTDETLLKWRYCIL